MPSVTVQGAGGVLPTITNGTNYDVARQAAAVINSAVNVQTQVATSGGTAPTVSGGPGLLAVDTTNPASINASSAYQYFVVRDVPAPVTVTGAGASNQLAILGTGSITFNTGGGSGIVVGGDGNKQINVGTGGTNFAIFTGAGNDTISLVSSAAIGRNTVEAGAAVTANTIQLGAAPTQVRSIGTDVVAVGGGAATIQVVGNHADTVTGGAGAMTFVNGSVGSTVNFSTLTTAPVSAGSATALGGAGGGYYRGGAQGSNLLVGGAGAVTLQGAGSGDVLIATGQSGLQLLQAGSGNETLLGSLSSTNNYFVAGTGENLIIAGSGNDTIYAGVGAATITGGGGSDLFVFDRATASGGRITITDFLAGTDHVTLRNYSAADAPAQLAAAAQRVAANASRITLSDGTTITFQGVSTVNSSFFI